MRTRAIILFSGIAYIGSKRNGIIYTGDNPVIEWNRKTPGSFPLLFTAINAVKVRLKGLPDKIRDIFNVFAAQKEAAWVYTAPVIIYSHTTTK